MAGEPRGEVNDTSSLDAEDLGFMCGLEIHQQLATGKLHSREAGELYDYTSDTVPDRLQRVSRRLRAASGEGGRVDVAARFEARRARRFVYIRSPNAGLIELDDQPPLQHDVDAVDISLTISAMLDAHPVPLLQAMRKTVIDGSNTSGFQRTTLVATSGRLETSRGEVGISLICLEEDSARRLSTELTQNGEKVTWNLDRLGIPLVEIATEPDVLDPEHAKETAILLGGLLRDTRRVRRGLGSIRQDLNVSIACGDRVEIKGCQDLDWIPRIIELEMARQLHMYRLANRLRQMHDLPLLSSDRRERSEDLTQRVESILPATFIDVSEQFSDRLTGMMVGGSGPSADVMLALPLPGFSGLLGTREDLDEGGAQMPRLGRELAGAAKLAGVGGVYHSDESPAHGMTRAEVDAVRQALDGADAFVLCLAPRWQAELALESVSERARRAFDRIPQEVRQVVVSRGAPEDGTTVPLRPLPGGARMYPETDVPPLHLDEARWKRISSSPPPSQAERLERMSGRGLSKDQTDQLVKRELDEEFIAGIEGTLASGLDRLAPKAWASLLLDSTRRNLADAAGLASTDVEPAFLAALLSVREQGGVTRDGVIALGADLLAAGGRVQRDIDVHSLLAEAFERAERLGLKPADSASIEAVVLAIIAERADFIAERGMAAMGPLMGVVLEQLGEGADGAAVSEILKRRLMDVI